MLCSRSSSLLQSASCVRQWGADPRRPRAVAARSKGAISSLQRSCLQPTKGTPASPTGGAAGRRLKSTARPVRAVVAASGSASMPAEGSAEVGNVVAAAPWVRNVLFVGIAMLMCNLDRAALSVAGQKIETRSFPYLLASYISDYHSSCDHHRHFILFRIHKFLSL